MSEKGSVAQKGGQGTNFEQWVQTGFLTTLIIGGNAPCLPSNQVIEVAVQTTSKGHHTDDILVKAKSLLGEHRLLIQAKTNITFSDDNATFNKVIADFWTDFNDATHFDKVKDRLIIVKSSLNHIENNHIKVLFDWARTHATDKDFLLEVGRVKEKETRLDIFRESLKKANGGKSVSDTQLWEFLRCLDLIAYDFTHVNSIAKTNFLNLIKLSKSASSELDEESIWYNIHARVCNLNPNGGNETVESIQKSVLFTHFNLDRLNPHFVDVQKLRSNSEHVLGPISNTIGDYHIPRIESSQNIINSVRNSQITIVAGKPGVGKTAVVKDALRSAFSEAGVFVFRADALNAGSIAHLLTSEGIHSSINDLFSCVALMPEKIIVIDSLEKLLEGDPNNAFRQLLSLAKGVPDLRIIATARSFSIDILCLRFGLDLNQVSTVDVPLLSDEEIAEVETRIPQLAPALSNPKIKQLLRSPKYLDLALKALPRTKTDLSTTSLGEFNETLWSALIKHSGSGDTGMSLKRENAFMHVAVERARQMKLFVRPAGGHEKAIGLLELDGILFQDGDKSRFAPSHDIFEDMALVRHVSQLNEDSSTALELVGKLGKEPAMRRAFRLWVEKSLGEDTGSFKRFITSAIDDEGIESFWKDEVLIAILKSNDCSLFFNQFEEKLLESDAQFLDRCIHVLRTGCKESAQYGSGTYLVPTGAGWGEIIKFIAQRIERLKNIKQSIYNLLIDWELGFIIGKNLRELDKAQVKVIVLYFIGEMEADSDSWDNDYRGEQQKQLIELLLHVADCAKQEISDLIDRALDRNDKHWRHRKLYETVLETCLSGLLPNVFVQECPELIIKAAWAFWKLPERKEPSKESIAWRISSDRLRGDECWGIRDKHGFFPSGVFKTPTYKLLQHHPLLAMKFICEFLNYSVDFYVAASCDYKHDIAQINIQLNDGSTISQHAASELWAAHRGSSVTHYAIECILMSLEKYLLSLAELKTEVSTANLRYMLNYLMSNSNNVAIPGVLCSIAMAYPVEVGEEMLPLIGVFEFYHWDLQRALNDRSGTLNPLDNEISFAQEERHGLNKLPHRTKHQNGLRDFVPWYQYNVGELNSKFHEVFDKMRLSVNENDLVENKLLSEIDIRTHQVGEYDAQIGGFPVMPTYDTPVAEHLDAHKPVLEEENRRLVLSNKLWNVYELKEVLTYENWCEGYDWYSNTDDFNFMIDRPLTLAVIGFRDFSEQLNEEQRLWCFQMIITVIQEKIVSLNDPYQGFNFRGSSHPLEKDMALKSIHLLFQSAKADDELKAVRYCLTQLLIAPYPDHELDDFILNVRNVLFEKFTDEATRGWKCLLKFAAFLSANPYPYRDRDLQQVFENQKENFLVELCDSDEPIVDLSDLSFETFDPNLLCRAVVICPFNSKNDEFGKLTLGVLPLIIEDLRDNENNPYSRRRNQRKLSSQSTRDVMQYLSVLILDAEDDLGNLVSKVLFESGAETGSTPVHGVDLSRFIFDVYEYWLLKYYDHSKLIKSSLKEDKRTMRFWDHWKYLANQIENSGTSRLLSILFFNVSITTGARVYTYVPPDESSWEALKYDDGKVFRAVSTFSKFGIHKYLLDLYSTIGDCYLPHGITELTVLIKKHDPVGQCLNTDAGVRLIKKIFYNHISQVKGDKSLMEGFLWILDRMVDLGKSEAYLFRENVITYKAA